MADKVLYQSVIHKLQPKPQPTTGSGYAPLDDGETLKDKYKRAINQAADVLVPGANPRRTKNRTGANGE